MAKKRINPSNYKNGSIIRLKKPLYGFPKGYPFTVVDGNKKPAYVNGKKCKYTILAVDSLAESEPTNKPANKITYAIPTNMIE